MEEKKIVERDYLDPATGLRFVEDIRGNLHCCSVITMNDSPSTPTPPIVIPPIEIPPIDVEIPPIEVTIPPVEIENPYRNSIPVVLQSTIKNYTWPSITTWNRIINSYGSGYVAYTTPFNKELHLTNVVVTITRHGEGLSNHSLLGLFKGGNLIMSLPVKEELNFSFFQPYVVEHSTFMEFKFLPFRNDLQFSILAIGYLI